VDEKLERQVLEPPMSVNNSTLYSACKTRPRVCYKAVGFVSMNRKILCGDAAQQYVDVCCVVAEESQTY